MRSPMPSVRVGNARRFEAFCNTLGLEVINELKMGEGPK